MDAVAKHFWATWEQGSDSPDAYLTIAGKRVAVDVTTFKHRGTGTAHKAGLRFDKVVIRLMDRLQASLRESVPDGLTVLLAVTAPIRLPSKTAAELEEKIPSLSQGRDGKATIHGNRVRVRLLRNEPKRAPKLIGFVHNSDSDPLLFFNITKDMLEWIGEAGRRTPKPAGDRWLVAISATGISSLEAYRYIYSQLGLTLDFKKALIVFGDGRVGVLSEL